jgi:hypothetical protein
MLVLGAMAAAVLAVSGGSASGATVSVRGHAPGVDEVAFVAAPGEVNRVKLRPRDEMDPIFGTRVAWTVSDTGAVLHAGESCSRIDDHTAHCRPRAMQLTSAVVTLGDLDDGSSIISEGNAGFVELVADGGNGDDELSGFVGHSVLRGGPGDDHLLAGSGGAAFGDTLDGGSGNDRLIGGRGHDRLRGGGGRDEIRGGEEADWLIDGDRDDAIDDAGPGPDMLDGGPGDDTVSYAERSVGVVVNLADGTTDGEPGEGDVLAAIESIVGGRAADRLTGDRRRNTINGGGGHNTLRGGGGDDQLERAQGPIACGGGDDIVITGGSSRNFPQPDCERVAREAFGREHPSYPEEVSRRQVVYRFSCYQPEEPDEDLLDEGPRACSASLRLRESKGRRSLLARGRLKRGHWDQDDLRARLTPRGRRLASRRHGVRAIVRLEEDGLGPPLRWTIRLRARR